MGGTADPSAAQSGTWIIPCGASAAVINQALADAGAYSVSTGGRGRVVIPDGLAFLLEEPLVVPANVDVFAGTARLIAGHADPMVMNSLAGCTGRYTGAGGWTWTGGSLDGANISTHGFSLAHCPRATISGATVWNTCLRGHAIEINSSGGPPNSKRIDAMTDADFTITVLGCQFRGVVSRRSNDCDEAVHFDYAWTGATYGHSRVRSIAAHRATSSPAPWTRWRSATTRPSPISWRASSGQGRPVSRWTTRAPSPRASAPRNFVRSSLSGAVPFWSQVRKTSVDGQVRASSCQVATRGSGRCSTSTATPLGRRNGGTNHGR